MRLALLLLLPASCLAAGTLRFAPGSGGAHGDSMYSVELGHGYEPGDPIRFSIRLPEGNYRVTTQLRGGRARQPVPVLAEQRRLMAEVITRHGELSEASFIVNVRTAELPPLPANATGGTRVALKPREVGSATWDEKLTLQFLARPTSITVEPVDVPTLYLTGDSTVTDQPQAPDGSWGQFITRYFNADIAVANHAESGETLKSFVTELRFDKLLSNLGAGDWVMIQFGHNDQKAQWPQTFADAATTYRSWLRTYIAEIRRRGATPLLVTSPERRNFDTDGRIRPTLAEYAEAMRAVAREEKVALIDLNASSVRIYEALGPAESPRAFADGGDDRTHHNDYGARQLARAVIEGLRHANAALTAGLEKHIAADAGRYDPSRPDPVPAP